MKENKKILLFCSSGKIDTQEKIIATTAAFTSWKMWGYDVLFFGDEYHKELCDEYGFILDTEHEKDRELALIRSMFQRALNYKHYDYYCYINTDIIFTKDILIYLNEIKKFEEIFCVTGQRMDIWELPYINFLKDNTDYIFNIINSLKKEMHDTCGIDYFCFTKDFWDINKIPNFRIARTFFDNWLINYGITEGNGKMIDLSGVFVPFHLEPHSRPAYDGKFLEEILENKILGRASEIRYIRTSDLLYYLNNDNIIIKK